MDRLDTSNFKNLSLSDFELTNSKILDTKAGILKFSMQNESRQSEFHTPSDDFYNLRVKQGKSQAGYIDKEILLDNRSQSKSRSIRNNIVIELSMDIPLMEIRC